MQQRSFRAALLVALAAFALPLHAADEKKPAAGAADKPAGLAVAKLDRKTPVDFEREVLPMLRSSCLACHGKTKPKSGLVLETPADIRKGGDNGPVAVAGKPEESPMFLSASHRAEEVMPPKDNKAKAPNLSAEQLGLLKLWIEQGAAGEVRADVKIEWQPVPAAFAPVYAVALSPDGQYAAAGRANRISVYHVPSKKLAAELVDPRTTDGAAKNAKPAAHRDVVSSLAFSPDGRTLASGGYREVKLWSRPDSDGGDWKLAKTLGTGDSTSPLADRVSAIAFDAKGERLATGGGEPSRGGEIKIWKLAGDGAADKPDLALDEVHSDAVLALAFSKDGGKLVTGSADKFVRLIDLKEKKVIRSFEGHTHHVLGVSLKSDGKVIASAGADNTLRFWDAETGERRKAQSTFDKEVTAVAYVGDTDQVVCAAGDGKVKLIKDTASDVRSFTGATGFVYAAAASADGSLVAAGGQDGVLRLWNAKGEPVATIAADGAVEAKTDKPK